MSKYNHLWLLFRWVNKHPCQTPAKPSDSSIALYFYTDFHIRMQNTNIKMFISAYSETCRLLVSKLNCAKCTGDERHLLSEAPFLRNRFKGGLLRSKCQKCYWVSVMLSTEPPLETSAFAKVTAKQYYPQTIQTIFKQTLLTILVYNNTTGLIVGITISVFPPQNEWLLKQ